MKPITKIVISIFFSFVVCQLTFMILSFGLRKYHVHKTESLTELLLNKTKHDILFIGSSRTQSNINPQIIDSICNFSSYNGGVEGGNLFEFKMMLNAYLYNHPAPKYLILTLDLMSFNLQKKLYNYVQYFPFIRNRVINEVLIESGHSTALYKILPFLEFTDYDDYTRNNCLKGLIGESEISKFDFQYKGYLSNTTNCITHEDTSNYFIKIKISTICIESLKNIVETCLRKNIKLTFTYAPEYKKGLQKHVNNTPEIFKLINKIAAKNKIPFWRHDNLDICFNPSFFANTGHLNKKGAEVYSLILGSELHKALIVF